MGSACEVVVDVATQQNAMDLAKLAIGEVKRIEAKYSRYQTDSLVWKINQQAGLGWTDCDDETLSLLDFADRLHQSSDGLFDITSGLLRKAWNFSSEVVPDGAMLQGLCARIGWRYLEHNGASVRLAMAGMELDFGGFGKEYAADRAATLLVTQGATSGYVNLAGDMRIIGAKPSGEPWQMGIQDPRKKDQIVATIPVWDGALATSGDYERYFESDGKRYCHILSPRTGMPVSHWRSVSVLAPLAVVAGGCSTIAMLLEEMAIDFLEESGFSYLAIDSQGAMYQNRSATPDRH
jgi:thiamine biosynthesis lipoprotein